jgi:indolepyruvate ferredoxin oxidoreductase
MIPLRVDSIEAAIRLNGVAVDQSLSAFRLGRLAVADPARIAEARPTGAGEPDERERAVAQLRGRERRRYETLLAQSGELDQESRRLLAIRLARLIAYQDAAYAQRYLDRVLSVARREAAVVSGRRELTHAVIRYLYKLMAYKDEYEVARLLLQPAWQQRVERSFDQPRVRYNLQPPALRALGLRRKIELGGWVRPLLAVLVRARRLRGTRWDLFGRTRVRREERELIDWYGGLLDEIGDQLSERTYDVAVELACVPDMIRGYEGIKMRNVEHAKGYAADKRRELRSVPLVS